MKSISLKDFTHTVGPTFVIPDSPLGIFHPFFTIEILQFIVEQTNKYALECIGHLLMENDPVYHYAPVASRIS